jgi:hypothetical protein
VTRSRRSRERRQARTFGGGGWGGEGGDGGGGSRESFAEHPDEVVNVGAGKVALAVRSEAQDEARGEAPHQERRPGARSGWCVRRLARRARG